MKYMLLIHQGDTPTPRSPEAWATLSEDEQKAVYADYQAINQTPGTPGLGLDSPETATTVRVQDGKTLTTDGPFVEIKDGRRGAGSRGGPGDRRPPPPGGLPLPVRDTGRAAAAPRSNGRGPRCVPSSAGAGP